MELEISDKYSVILVHSSIYFGVQYITDLRQLIMARSVLSG